jgi:hypothetical protein
MPGLGAGAGGDDDSGGGGGVLANADGTVAAIAGLAPRLPLASVWLDTFQRKMNFAPKSSSSVRCQRRPGNKRPSLATGFASEQVHKAGDEASTTVDQTLIRGLVTRIDRCSSGASQCLERGRR